LDCSVAVAALTATSLFFLRFFESSHCDPLCVTTAQHLINHLLVLKHFLNWKPNTHHQNAKDMVIAFFLFPLVVYTPLPPALFSSSFDVLFYWQVCPHSLIRT